MRVVSSNGLSSAGNDQEFRCNRFHANNHSKRDMKPPYIGPMPGTTMGVLANVSSARAGGRAILGFIAYGHAQMLLRLDRIEEYLLFLYAHRYHDHTPGSWTAGEV